MENYYLRCMTPTLHGLYIDGRGLLDQLSKLDNNSIQKIATRYFDLMSAVTIFGVISTNNTKRNGALQQDAQRAKKLVMDIYSLPMSSSYSATSKHTEHARTLGIPEKPYTLPVAQIKTEITRGLGLDDAGKITLAEDMTGAPKAQYRNESRVVSNDTTQWAVWWLNEMVYELKDVQDIEQSRGTSRVLNSAKK